jgi:hypothetical protein
MRLKMIFDDGEEYISCFVDDASASGMMLETPIPLPIGREVRLEPADPLEDAWFELRGIVTRCYPVDADESIARWGTPNLYAVGVRLIDVSPEQELAIRKAIREVERRSIGQQLERI